MAKIVDVSLVALNTLSGDELHKARLQMDGVDLPPYTDVYVGPNTKLSSGRTPGHNSVFEKWTLEDW